VGPTGGENPTSALKKILCILWSLFGGAPPVGAPLAPGVIVKSAVLENGHILSAVPAVLRGIDGWNANPAPQWVLLFDAVSEPVDGTAATYTLGVSGEYPFWKDWRPAGIRFTTGIYVCNSSTPFVKTIGAADCAFTGELAP